MGHELEPVDIDPAAELLGCFRDVMVGNIAALAFKDSELIDPIVRGFYEAGQKMSAGHYVNVLLEMHNRSRAIVQSLMPCDALLTPTLSRPAMRVGELVEVDKALAWLPFTFPFNATVSQPSPYPTVSATKGYQ
jgi:Asp-tRNA(Asn)/Glu-tRNA(Gln) amidotransferase A subunit family amidase